MMLHNWLLLKRLNINHSKMYEEVFHVVLNKIGKFLCVVEQTQSYRFYSFFPVILLGSNAIDVKNIWPFYSSATQNQQVMMFCFLFYANFDFNGHFRHFDRPFELKNQRKTLLFNLIQCHKLKNIKCQQIWRKLLEFNSVRMPRKKFSLKPL